uniref:hypothetical protein n=1 Tax=Corynebacterium ulcerans TaxID=65058 RepID=UPI001F28FAF6|nr:hypothetical protein [Corynebacterium ulcerans]
MAPVTGQSGSSIRGEYPARPGHKRQKHLVLLSIRYHPQPRAISQLLRTQANRRKAPQCGCNFLARRRCNVIFTMLKNKEFFREIPARPQAT